MDINADLHTDLREMFQATLMVIAGKDQYQIHTHTHTHTLESNHTNHEKKSISKRTQQEREKRTNNPNNQAKSQKMIDKMASVSSYLLILSKWLKFSNQNEE